MKPRVSLYDKVKSIFDVSVSSQTLYFTKYKGYFEEQNVFQTVVRGSFRGENSGVWHSTFPASDVIKQRCRYSI